MPKSLTARAEHTAIQLGQITDITDFLNFPQHQQLYIKLEEQKRLCKEETAKFKYHNLIKKSDICAACSTTSKNRKIEFYHPVYTEPLAGIWLCRSCLRSHRQGTEWQKHKRTVKLWRSAVDLFIHYSEKVKTFSTYPEFHISILQLLSCADNDRKTAESRLFRAEIKLRKQVTGYIYMLLNTID